MMKHLDELSVPEFEIVDPLAAITKMGAGANLYTIDISQGEPRIVSVAYLSMRDVMDIYNSGGKFLEVKR